MNRLDAWAFAKLLSGGPINGELEAVSGPFRDLGERLATLPFEERARTWNDFLADLPDRDRITQAVADADPTGPAPEATADDDGSGEQWGPIRLGSLPRAELFPLDTLPIPVRDLANAAAKSIACPVDYPAVAALAAASGLIGRSVVLHIKDGYEASASLYAALVGGPSSGKSPALGFALAPVWALAEKLQDRWRTETKDREVSKSQDSGDGTELGRIVSTDPTTEALAPLLAKNPRGLIVAPDEMTKWVMSMDQYKGGKGGDRPFYLSVWGGEPVFIDRAKYMREPIVVPHPFLTVIGGMTPDMLSTLSEAKGREDGFLARLLFCFPERTPRRYSSEGIPESLADAWHNLASALRERPMAESDGKPVPLVVRLTPGAASEWASWCQAHYDEQEADSFPESMEGPWGKLEAYAARLSLVLHLMDLAADPTRPALVPPPDLPRETVVNAVRLVTYFKAHALRIHATMNGKARDGGDDVRSLVKWLLRNDRLEFSTRDISRDFDRFRDDEAALADALDWMTTNNLVRRQLVPKDGPRGGRKRTPSFDVNPSLMASPRFRHFRQNPRS
jgi:hypothetical protein